MTTGSEIESASPVGPALRDAKRILRERVLAARDQMAADARDAATAAITQGIAALSSFAAAHTVLLTLAFRSEWDTLPLVRAAIKSGKRVALPRVDTATRMLVLHAIADPAVDILPGYSGIPEPTLSCVVVMPQEIDWVLVPGVAFDTVGRRLGYGGGFYDRLLPLFSARTARVAGAFELQMVERVPAAPHDLAIDTIVTERRTITAHRATAPHPGPLPADGARGG